MSTEAFKEQSKDFIVGRVETATHYSPIAVFTIHRRGKLCLSAVFANTANTKRMIDNQHHDLVGVFNGDESKGAITQSLNKALRRKI